MILEHLLASTELLSIGGVIKNLADITVMGLSYDSRSVVPGSLFFALPGSHNHGTSFVQEALDQGAVAIVSQEDIPNLSVPLIRVSDCRIAMADLATSFYGHPSHSLMACGITGTNGKTTTAYLVRHLCEACGRSSGLIGTVEYILPGIKEEASRTTPESIDLQRMMADMTEGGFKAVAMEVSSHAIIQERVRGTEFDVAVFTNLSQDHLDYHGSMEAYFEAKVLLFKRLSEQVIKRGRAVINADDRYAHLLMERLSSR